jgi:hypothetical protein
MYTHTIDTSYEYVFLSCKLFELIVLVTTNSLSNLIRSHVILLPSLVVNRKLEILFWGENRNNPEILRYRGIPTILINQTYLYFYLIIIV